MPIYYFLLVVSSLACGSLPPKDIDVSEAFGATALMVSGWILLSHVSARMLSKYAIDGEIEPLTAARWLETQMSIFRWLGLTISVFCHSVFGLARTLESIPVVGESMFLQSLILLAPGVAITVGTWSAEHRYGVRLGYTDATIKNHVLSLWRSFRSAMAWLVAPVLLLLGLFDLLRVLPLSDTALTWTTFSGILLFVPLVLPWMTRHLFKTTPVTSEDMQWVSSLMKSAGVGRTKVVRWDTQSTAFNAMVTGFVPPLRTLFLSDRLMDELPTEQTAMVILHEAAHLKRRHVPIRMLGMMPAWLAGVTVTQLLGDHSLAMIAGSATGILLTVAMLRVIAYRTEFDADVTACHMAVALAPQHDQLPSNYEDAHHALSLALMRVTGDQPASREPTWLHPGVAQRIDFMKRKLCLPESVGVMGSTA